MLQACSLPAVTQLGQLQRVEHSHRSAQDGGATNPRHQFLLSEKRNRSQFPAEWKVLSWSIKRRPRLAQPPTGPHVLGAVKARGSRPQTSGLCSGL